MKNKKYSNNKQYCPEEGANRPGWAENAYTPAIIIFLVKGQKSSGCMINDQPTRQNTKKVKCRIAQPKVALQKSGTFYATKIFMAMKIPVLQTCYSRNRL
jgi:hypothetical protein